MIFEVTLSGFNIEDCSTDHNVWWFKAPTQQALDTFLDLFPRELKEPPVHLKERDEQISESEVDMVLDGLGFVVSSRRKW